MRIGLAKYLLLPCLLWAVPVVATTYTITSTNLTGTGTLAKAVDDANAHAGADTIDLTRMSGTLDIPFLSVTDSVVLQGPGKDKLILKMATGYSKIFSMSGASKNYTIQGLELTGASYNAIDVSATNSLTMFDVRIRGNTSDLYGGIHFAGKSLSIDQCEFIDNKANPVANVRSGIGGALTVESLNTTDATAAVSITRSVFIGNTADRQGGAIYSKGRSNVKILNSTISGNWAQEGGGIYLEDSSAVILSSTIAANTASTGAGVKLRGYTLSLSGSVVANNVEGNDVNCANSAPISNGYNFLENVDSKCIGLQTTDIVGQDPKLGSLVSIDGGHLGHLPLVGSILVNAIPATLCEAVDQRGLPRPSGAGAFCDIGAIEVECGNGVPELPLEECDDGKNGNNLDGCLDSCKLPACGDAIFDSTRGEQCDDGNGVDNDNCSNQCKINVVITTPSGPVVVSQETAQQTGAEILSIQPADLPSASAPATTTGTIVATPNTKTAPATKTSEDQTTQTSTAPQAPASDSGSATVGGGGCSLIVMGGIQ